VQKTCRVCGDSFEARRSDAVYCPKPRTCKSKAQNLSPKRKAYNARYYAPGTDAQAKRNAAARAANVRRRAARRFDRLCEFCDRPFVAPHEDTRSCDRPTCTPFYRARTFVTELPWRYPTRSTAVPLCSALRIWPCADPACPNTFRAVYPDAVYCSEECQRRVRERVRARQPHRRARALARRQVRRQSIFERDGWTCQLCTGPIDQSAECPADLAGVLDHVIPRVHGGTDDPDNLQAAHFVCNTEKGDVIGWFRTQPRGLGQVSAA
jgi:5-methylcytosine-specific restriction endonuclease McrA